MYDDGDLTILTLISKEKLNKHLICLSQFSFEQQVAESLCFHCFPFASEEHRMLSNSGIDEKHYLPLLSLLLRSSARF